MREGEQRAKGNINSSNLKTKDILISALSWRWLEDIVLIETRQTQKDRHYGMLLT